jgi:hypothetical protein
VPPDFEIEPVRKQRFELNAQEPPLAEHAAALLDVISKVFLQRFVVEHERLAKQRAKLRSADGKRARVPRKVGQRNIGSLRANEVPSLAPST